MFRSINTLGQKAGVPPEYLRRLALKELTDNALDAGANQVRATALSDGGYSIEDDGAGIPGDEAAVAGLFSIKRALRSSKLLRLPTRGALGNGLRVVSGTVIASGGRLKVTTGGFLYELVPQDSGDFSVEKTPVQRTVGTKVEIWFGRELPEDAECLTWAQEAIEIARRGRHYNGRSSPWWYDSDAFFELFHAGGDRYVRELISELDGCTGPKAGHIAAEFRNRVCRSLTREEATQLLRKARSQAKPVPGRRLGFVGAEEESHYARINGTFSLGGQGELDAEIPYLVEAWVGSRPGNGDRSVVSITVNRTPVAGGVFSFYRKRLLVVRAFGSFISVPVSRAADFNARINVIAPHVPITTEGKEPDLAHFSTSIRHALEKAVSKSLRNLPRQSSKCRSHREITLAHLASAVAKASGDGTHRFAPRQVFYVLRPLIIAETKTEPSWDNFSSILTDYENEHGEIPGMYRDPRGTLYHPHLGDDIAIGTVAVEQYQRPKLTFNKVLYIEKEGFFEVLKEAKWPERHDCALLTSKGFSTRAVRDLLDLLADDGEQITVFCVHDADAYGTMIFQTLQEATKARGRRKAEIVNLGLDPDDVEELGLEVESVRGNGRIRAVARYADAWSDWYQVSRVELNAMTSPQFVAWLDRKMAAHGTSKIIPPCAVLKERLLEKGSEILRTELTERILREARVDEQVEKALSASALPNVRRLRSRVQRSLVENPVEHWAAPIEREARRMVQRALDKGGVT